MRLILDAPAAGRWNMAVDELLLANMATAPELTLRLYQWSPATLSLGYFQPYAERAAHPTSRPLDVVRRPSGGGAIVHDQELTYSLTLPPRHTLGRDSQALYRRVHGVLIELFAREQVTATLFAAETVHATSAEPFLCFQRRSTGDIVIGRDKVVGSAQRKRHGAILQHGSILLAASPHAPELPGIAELTGRHLPPSSLQLPFAERIAALAAESLELRELSADERARTDTICQAQFDNPAWNEKR